MFPVFPVFVLLLSLLHRIVPTASLSLKPEAKPSIRAAPTHIGCAAQEHKGTMRCPGSAVDGATGEENHTRSVRSHGWETLAQPSSSAPPTAVYAA